LQGLSSVKIKYRHYFAGIVGFYRVIFFKVYLVYLRIDRDSGEKYD